MEASMATEDNMIAKLNEVTDLLSALSSGRLRALVNPVTRFDQVAGCTGNCDCKGGYCGCNASVTALERFGNISYPEFLELREARMKELKAELARLEQPKGLLEQPKGLKE
jgi:hypothetical protein